MLNLTVLKGLGNIVTSTIGSAVSHVNHSFNKEKVVQGGAYTRWKIAPARTNKTDQVVTLFMFDKKDLDENNIQTRLVLDSLKIEALNLQRLRHPKILNIVDPLVETKYSLDFATKPVLGTLEMFKHRMSTLEVKSGILDVCEALKFLHQNAKLVHLNVNPHSIYIDANGRWLLGGMAYTKELAGSEITCDFPFSGPRHLSNGTTMSVDPPLGYSAPETTQGRCSTASDVFSLALVALECLSTAIDLGDNAVAVTAPPIATKQRHNAEMTEWLYKLKSRRTALPPSLYAMLISMLDVDPRRRPSLNIFETNLDFNDVPLRAVKFLDAFAEKDDVQKTEFLKAFYPLMVKTPELRNEEVLRSRVLPPLLINLNHQKFVAILPSVLRPTLWIVTERLNDSRHFIESVWPHLMPLLSANEIQIESVLLLLDSLGPLVALSSPEIQSTYWVPFMLKCLSIPNDDIQKSVLKQLPMLFKHTHDGTLKVNVLPKILDLISSERCSPKLRCDGVKTLAEMATYLDRTSILEYVIPSIKQISRIDRTGETTGAIFQLIDAMRGQMGVEMTISHLMSLALPILTNPLLDGPSYAECYRVVEDSLTKFHQMKVKEHKHQQESQGVVSTVLNLPAQSKPEISWESVGVESAETAATRLEQLLDFPSVTPTATQPVFHPMFTPATSESPMKRKREKKVDTDLISLQDPSPTQRPPSLPPSKDLESLFAQPSQPFTQVTQPSTQSSTQPTQPFSKNFAALDDLFSGPPSQTKNIVDDPFAGL
eukprot:Blabericola_migrator_1__184@NODE_104_length_14270_cov_182_757446_g92_i0_p3_GENE_NODE_104_length_14270_cov_182_757446_g92_i0NODE_104_length_14270_cov_182_757446_g92_i0_p3_ORF_typecomplete_len769_score193_45Pkinase/PF00069_25/5_7e20Pkinase_Tyr/PF07714_17/2_9e15Kinaselike/PF14531_6/1_8e06Arm_2/PF04826_13/3_2e02Arm_2/PF04826_13/0_1Proteasom_PSMB/PF10508_9/0_08_NODE_104_length_14270_cov_182_757446_g92_i0542360